MTFLPILTLAAGLNMAANAPVAASHAQRAETTLNRLVATAEPALRNRALGQSLAQGAQTCALALAQTIAAATPNTGVAGPASHARRAQTNLDRRVNDAQAKLAARAVHEALAGSLRAYNRTLALEIARSGEVHEIARQAAAKKVAPASSLPF